MSPTIREYAEHIEKEAQVVWIAGEAWAVSGGVLRPLTPPHLVRPVDRLDVRRALRRCSAHLAMWNAGWDTLPCGWWYICCDQRHYCMNMLRTSKRRYARRGLEQCEIRRVDADWFARNGYAVYAAAFRSYGKRPPLTKGDFFELFKHHAEYSGRETWGAFLGEKLIAWASCVIVEDAVMLSSTKSDPGFQRAHPNEPLVYTITRHYLAEREYRYVIGGARRLSHDTQFQEFLLEMGYRRVFSHLRVELTPATALATALRLDVLGRALGLGRLVKHQCEQMEAVAAAVRIANACTRHADADTP